MGVRYSENKLWKAAPVNERVGAWQCESQVAEPFETQKGNGDEEGGPGR